jgi:hypothetical protein
VSRLNDIRISNAILQNPGIEGFPNNTFVFNEPPFSRFAWQILHFQERNTFIWHPIVFRRPPFSSILAKYYTLSKFKDSWQSIYFELRPNLLKVWNSISKFKWWWTGLWLIPVSVRFEKVNIWNGNLLEFNLSYFITLEEEAQGFSSLEYVQYRSPIPYPHLGSSWRFFTLTSHIHFKGLH